MFGVDIYDWDDTPTTPMSHEEIISLEKWKVAQGIEHIRMICIGEQILNQSEEPRECNGI